MRFQTAPTGPGDSNGRRGLYPRPQQTGTMDNKYYRHIFLNFIKFVVQGLPQDKIPFIERTSFIIKLALFYNIFSTSSFVPVLCHEVTAKVCNFCPKNLIA